MAFFETMSSNLEPLYWKSNPEWWRVDRETGRFALTDKAPERARKSFEMYTAPHPRSGAEKGGR